MKIDREESGVMHLNCFYVANKRVIRSLTIKLHLSGTLKRAINFPPSINPNDMTSRCKYVNRLFVRTTPFLDNKN